MYTLLINGTKSDAVKAASKHGLIVRDVADVTGDSILLLVDERETGQVESWLCETDSQSIGELLWAVEGDALREVDIDGNRHAINEDHDCNNCCGHCNGAK